MWIGLAEVHQRPGANVLLDRNDAFVNVLAQAYDRASFHRAIVSALHGIGFELIQLDDAEPLRVRLESYDLEDEVLQLAQEVKATGEPRLGQFHTWRSNDQ